MPTTRRSTGPRAGPTKGQSTISFHHKVTKASTPQDAKKAVLSEPAVAKVEAPAEEKPKIEDVIAEPEPASEEEQDEPEVEAVPEKPEAEVKAEKVTDAQINKYWKAIENERTAPRVHQKDLSQSEKVLRYFDVSSQYGVSLFQQLFLYRARVLIPLLSLVLASHA
jgi:DNA polymerase delta subunit 4